MVSPADSTLTAIRKKVRRLTASSSESALTTVAIDEYINTFYSQDFPYAIKTDQMRSVYTFYTSPNIDKYPLNVNYNQGVRDPIYFEGVQGSFFKDRDSFFKMWPRWPTKFTQSTGSEGTIQSTTQTNPCVVNSTAHGLTSGDVVTIAGVSGMTQLNGNTYVVSVIDANSFSIPEDASLFPNAGVGGTWTASVQIVSFTISGTPFLSREVVIGGISTSGTVIRVADDGYGNLYLQTPKAVTSVPAITSTDPGMKNLNTGNPGDLVQVLVGTVDYVTGDFALNFALGGVVPDRETDLTIWVSQYSASKPYTMLFWNNEFTIRPVPDNVYKVEIETYLTPVQFLLNTDSPILNQWWQYIAIGAAIKVLEDRNDIEGVSTLIPLFDRQESLILERQGVEEIGQRNSTIFSSAVQQQGWNSGQGWY